MRAPERSLLLVPICTARAGARGSVPSLGTHLERFGFLTVASSGPQGLHPQDAELINYLAPTSPNIEVLSKSRLKLAHRASPAV